MTMKLWKTLTKKRKVLIVFDDMIASMTANKKLCTIVAGLFPRGRKLNISLAFISQSYFKVSKTIRFNSTHIILSWKFLTKENFKK